jgi:hypothetical protein
MKFLTRSSTRGALLLALTLAVSFGCASGRALIDTSPDAAGQQGARTAALQVVYGIQTGVAIVRRTGADLPSFPIPAAERQRIDCGIARVLGTSTPAPEPVVAACGHPIPLAAEAPFALALDTLAAVSTCASLGNTIAALERVYLPLFDALNESSSAPVRTLGASLRFALAVLAPGHVACG